jgi:GDPmannose 4,6-dehydratase
MPRALITGISGQDGSYLAELLLSKGYDVHGTVRPTLIETPTLRPKYLARIEGGVTIHSAKLEEPDRLAGLLASLDCDECYHLAGPSTVDSNMQGDPATFKVILASTKSLLQVIEKTDGKCRLFFAGSSEMFGRVNQSPQDERTAFQPRSLYGLARLSGYHAIRQFRHRTGGFACTGILYNHESPRRAPAFLPRKVSLAAARIKIGKQRRLALGNLEAVRDWGYAPDFVEAMWLMLRQPAPQDFVIATGRTHRVADLVELAFRTVDLDYRKHVDVDPTFFRPAEALPLCGDFSYLAKTTGWGSKKAFNEFIAEMVNHDLAEQSAPTSSLA